MSEEVSKIFRPDFLQIPQDCQTFLEVFRSCQNLCRSNHCDRKSQGSRWTWIQNVSIYAFSFRVRKKPHAGLFSLLFLVYLTLASSQRIPPEDDSKDQTVSPFSSANLPSGLQVPPGVQICSSNSDCHIDLNERCVQVSYLPYMICGCGQAFVRNNVNGVCELKKGVRIVLRFNSLAFVSEYLKTTTPGFIRMRELTESTLLSIVNSSSQLTDCVKDIRIVSFQKPPDEPSNEASLEAEALIYITNSLYQSIKSRENSLALVFVKEISVSIHELNNSRFSTNPEFDVVVTQIEADVDPCQVDDLNYCSPNSLCFFALNENRYSCSCKDRFTDLSPHPRFLGEVCSLECPDNYCSNDGHCHVDKVSSALYCTCNHWNVGSRCQYSGIIVFSVLGVIFLLLLFVVGCTASAFCGQRRDSNVTDSSDISRHRLMQPKPSLLSSCPEDHSARPFRITIDNLNYASDTSMTPVIQFSPSSLVQQSSRESCDFTAQHHSHHSPHHSQHVVKQVIHHPPPDTEAHCPHPITVPTSQITHMLPCHPTPSPRPSLSSTVAVQTENYNRTMCSEVTLCPSTVQEVSLDKPARGPRILGNEKVYAEGNAVKNEPDSVQMSWC